MNGACQLRPCENTKHLTGPLLASATIFIQHTVHRDYSTTRVQTPHSQQFHSCKLTRTYAHKIILRPPPFTLFTNGKAVWLWNHKYAKCRMWSVADLGGVQASLKEWNFIYMNCVTVFRNCDIKLKKSNWIHVDWNNFSKTIHSFLYLKPLDSALARSYHSNSLI